VGIVKNESTAKQFKLLSCYPNPFNSTITLSYISNIKKDISITIYDFNGKYIKSIINYALTPGTQTVRWDGTDQFSRPVAAGMYLYLIEGVGSRQTGKMIYLK
jgi:flagellar hook assembly protein FlgD